MSSGTGFISKPIKSFVDFLNVAKDLTPDQRARLMDDVTKLADKYADGGVIMRGVTVLTINTGGFRWSDDGKNDLRVQVSWGKDDEPFYETKL